MRRRSKIVARAGLLIAAVVYLNNTSLFSPSMRGEPSVLAHRGLSQRYAPFRAGAEPCEVRRMLPPTHDFIENTLRSMEAAFAAGADVVEIDVQVTRDGRFAVFHDRRLDCRTDGRGLVREHTMDELKTLDVAYGYTADGGRTYPFRGRGAGLMPSLDEVFDVFPERAFLIDLKSDAPLDGALLGEHLERLAGARRLQQMIVFGRESALAGLVDRLPGAPVFSTTSIQRCLVPYIAYGWTGLVPSACRDAPLFVPINVAGFLWGWPERFMDRLRSAGSRVVAIGEFGVGEFAAGLDTPEDLDRLPEGFDGGIWTNDPARVRARIDAAATAGTR